MEFGKEYKMIHILVNGKTPKPTDMVFTHGLTEIDMKANGICA